MPPCHDKPSSPAAPDAARIPAPPCARSSTIARACSACSTSRRRWRAPRPRSASSRRAPSKTIVGRLQGRALRHRGARRSRRRRRQRRDPACQGADRRGRKKIKPQAARYVHWGATSQDVIDTALVLELRAAIDALLTDLDRAIRGFTTTGRTARRTPTVARTWLQHALPMPFGLKVAGLCRGAGALARAAAAAAQGGAGAAIRRRRRHARRARRPRPRCRRTACRPARSSAARCAVAQPSRPARRGRRAPLRSSPAPAARSRAMSR